MQNTRQMCHKTQTEKNTSECHNVVHEIRRGISHGISQISLQKPRDFAPEGRKRALGRISSPK